MRGSLGMAMLMFAAMSARIGFGGNNYKDKDALDEIDIEKEYQLIKQKKSKLGYRDRQRVLYEYKKSLKE